MLSYRFMAMNMRGLQNHRPDFRGGTEVDISISSNIIVPTGALTGQRLAMEFVLPLYQDLNGTQLRNEWQFTVGWQYAFGL